VARSPEDVDAERAVRGQPTRSAERAGLPRWQKARAAVTHTDRVAGLLCIATPDPCVFGVIGPVCAGARLLLQRRGEPDREAVVSEVQQINVNYYIVALR